MLPEQSLRRCASASDLNSPPIRYDSQDDDDQIAVIDHLQKLHDNVITEFQSLNRNLSEQNAVLETKYAEQQLATKQLDSAEISRKKGATKRARAREHEIARLKEELQYEKNRNKALQDYTAQADDFIHDTQEDVQRLKFQLERAHRQREEKESRASRLISSNKDLHRKLAATAKETEERRHEQDVTEKKLMDNAVQAREKACLALIQRDLERARREAGVPFSAEAQAYDDKALSVCAHYITGLGCREKSQKSRDFDEHAKE
ncbi:hypothetical protein ACJ73_07264 [Blastomyces percursus]|uniref:Uncharacterized protein n=1 Tax=Blastomyces percursus TaxID=1658174 RepID=A0A1J9QMH1_9EURO|nr:hypothetical protein ACJ73_07264 [Blastomyces percursus]